MARRSVSSMFKTRIDSFASMGPDKEINIGDYVTGFFLDAPMWVNEEGIDTQPMIIKIHKTATEQCKFQQGRQIGIFGGGLLKKMCTVDVVAAREEFGGRNPLLILKYLGKEKLKGKPQDIHKWTCDMDDEIFEDMIFGSARTNEKFEGNEARSDAVRDNFEPKDTQKNCESVLDDDDFE